MPDNGTETAEGQDRFLPQSMDDLRGRTIEEYTRMLEVLTAHLRSLHQTDDGELRDLDDAEQAAFDLGLQMREEIVRRIDEHNKIAEIFRRRPESVQRVYANLSSGLDDPAGDVRRLTNGQARDQALRMLDSRDTMASELRPHQQDQVARLVRRDPTLARRILVTEDEHYRTAWMKLVTQPHPNLDADQQRAIARWDEFRAMGEVGPTTGGYGVPAFVDPSIILTDQESGNPFLQIARQVTINSNIWDGVSAAGMSWSFDTEGTAVSDDSVTLAQPAITVHMARGFIPYSIELGMDYPGFASEMASILTAGYDELLVDKLTRGTGTGEPKGILTAISAVSGDRVKVTTGGSIGAPDPYLVWKALPQKYRRRASWLMSVGVNNAIRQIGTANVFHGYTVNLPEGWADQLFSRPVYESPYMPDATSWTTTASCQAIVGDFNNFLIVRNGGMSVELVPQLFSQVTAGTGPAVPTGQRGWFAHARIGADCVNTSGFRVLVANS